MKILLTGATGFLGFRILERLVSLNGIGKVVATGRTLKQTHQVTDPKAEYKLGSLADEKFVNDLVKDVDVIIHAAALSSPWGTEQEFINANILPQQHLIGASKKCNVSRFIYVSTPSIYFNSKDRFMIREDEPLPEKFINHYAAT